MNHKTDLRLSFYLGCAIMGVCGHFWHSSPWWAKDCLLAPLMVANVTMMIGSVVQLIILSEATGLLFERIRYGRDETAVPIRQAPTVSQFEREFPE